MCEQTIFPPFFHFSVSSFFYSPLHTKCTVCRCEFGSILLPSYYSHSLSFGLTLSENTHLASMPYLASMPFCSLHATTVYWSMMMNHRENRQPKVCPSRRLKVQLNQTMPTQEWVKEWQNCLSQITLSHASSAETTRNN